MYNYIYCRNCISLTSMGITYCLYTTNKTEWQSLKKILSKFCIHEMFNKHFTITSKIGQGSFSNVYEAYKLHNFKRVAVKAIYKKQLIDHPKFAVYII